MAMKKKAPKYNLGGSASGSDRGAKTKATEAKRKVQASVAGSDRKLKEKNRQGELAYLRKGPVSYYSTGQMITDMSELKRVLKMLAKDELERKVETAKKRKGR